MTSDRVDHFLGRAYVHVETSTWFRVVGIGHGRVRVRCDDGSANSLDEREFLVLWREGLIEEHREVA